MTTQPAAEHSPLYGVGGQVWTFIDAIQSDLQMREQWNMAQRARELKLSIQAHDSQIDEISKRVTVEAKAEVNEREELIAALRDVAIPSLHYCEQKYGHDDQARLNLEAVLERVEKHQ